MRRSFPRVRVPSLVHVHARTCEQGCPHARHSLATGLFGREALDLPSLGTSKVNTSLDLSWTHGLSIFKDSWTGFLKLRPIPLEFCHFLPFWSWNCISP